MENATNSSLSSAEASMLSRSSQSLEVDSPVTNDVPEINKTGLAPPPAYKPATPLDLMPKYMRNAIKALEQKVTKVDSEDSILVGSPSPETKSLDVCPTDKEDDLIRPSPKRKRASINYSDLDDPRLNKEARNYPNAERLAKRSKVVSKIRGTLIGVWRDSDQSNDLDKHAVYGFIDIHDRLRTRIYGMNRRNEDLAGNMPTGAGGCWVTFERIIFDDHLKDLSGGELKEYVKLRTNVFEEGMPEEREALQAKLIIRAKERASGQEAANPSSVSRTPRYRPSPRLSKADRLRMAQGIPWKQSPGKEASATPQHSLPNTPSLQAINAAQFTIPKASPISDKPNGVVIGYWADSDSAQEADKHAVYGLVGETDSFRIKVQRLTRDGRYIEGNFPTGPGAMWLHFDKVILEPQLTLLSRVEVKEYVRIRTRQLQNGETERDKKINEAKAIREAKAIVATDAVSLNTGAVHTKIGPEPEIRHSARAAAKQQAEAEAAAAKVVADKAEKRGLKVHKDPHDKKDLDMRKAFEDSAPIPAARAELKNNLKKLNTMWATQQLTVVSPTPMPVTLAHPTTAVDSHGTLAGTIPVPAPSMSVIDETKYHNGIKYERKQNGPFQGKLVSSAQILSIDGEDYVEYRVLTKPSFF